MSFMDKLKNRFQMTKGHAKQGAGRATGDPYLESEGQSERISGGTRQVGEQVKDAGKNMKKAFKR
ncbi:MAG: CsbD family protein [Streptosporangiaceae bacterium]